jgi:hypothetical protein
MRSRRISQPAINCHFSFCVCRSNSIDKLEVIVQALLVTNQNQCGSGRLGGGMLSDRASTVGYQSKPMRLRSVGWWSESVPSWHPSLPRVPGTPALAPPILGPTVPHHRAEGGILATRAGQHAHEPAAVVVEVGHVLGGGQLAVGDAEEVPPPGQLAEQLPGALVRAVVGGVAARDPELHRHGAVAADREDVGGPIATEKKTTIFPEWPSRERW